MGLLMFEGVVPGTSIQGLIGDLSRRGLSGSLVCKIEAISKSVNIWQGNVVSASSSLIDDRLGEVIYREGRLSLDAFVDAAGKVTKSMRFGDLLIKSGLFTELDLWNALIAQSKSILTSLCFYDEISVRFEELPSPPKFELPLQFDLDQLFTQTYSELSMLRIFDAQARHLPKLEIVEGSLSGANSDFLRDMVGLAREAGDYIQVVDTASRLSQSYTSRVLYELVIRGVVKDSWGLAAARISPEGFRALKTVIEDVNFMFMELFAAARKEGFEDSWHTMVNGAIIYLKRSFGEGHFLTPEHGFLPDNILNVVLLRDDLRSFAHLNFNRHWPENVGNTLREKMTSVVLFILFELCNRKFGSEEFARVKKLIDGMRHSQT